MVALSIHADYRCGHSGRCCSTDWDVPVESSARAAIEAGQQERRLPLVEPFAAGFPPEGYAGVLRRERGACVFFDQASRLCAVHGQLGQGALPVTCRQFPRIARTGPRGVAITLSHYCPTAARMLLREDVPLAVVEQPEAFPPGSYEGLQADDWPPLLHPRMLMDEASYDAWEAHVVWRCATVSSLWSALATIRRDAEALCRWRPEDGVLMDAVLACRSRAVVQVGVPDGAWVHSRIRDAREAVPEAEPVEERLDLSAGLAAMASFERAALRLVAAHGFASWCAYQARGIAAHVRSLETVAAVLLVEVARVKASSDSWGREGFLAAVGATDFLLRHEASREALAAVWTRREVGAG